MRRVLLALLAVLWAAGADAQTGVQTGAQTGEEPSTEEIVLGLSSNRVAITATFDGSDILIFGAIKRDAPPPEDASPLQVIVTVSGPRQPLTVRQADRRMGLWVNASAVEVDAAPSFYAVTSTGPLSDILSVTEDLRHSITIPRAIRAIGNEVGNREDYLDALIRIREAKGLYQVLERSIAFTEQTLFRAQIDLPANLVEGDYATRIFLTRDGEVLDVYQTTIFVRKTGIERWLHALSQEQPFLYGLLALAVAIAAGWGASEAFRALRG